MDIAAAIAALGHASTIVKTLRSIDKNYDVATVKAQMVELYESLADVKMALSDAREALHDRDKQSRVLHDKITALQSGEVCPICNNGRLKVIASKPHPHFAFAGILERTVECTECGHTEPREYNPKLASRP